MQRNAGAAQVAAWWARVGGAPRFAAHAKTTLAAAVDHLAGAWYTEPLVDAAASASTMTLVRLPGNGGKTAADSKTVQDALFERFVECPVKTVGGHSYVRVSVGPYNDIDDFTRLAEVVRDLRL